MKRIAATARKLIERANASVLIRGAATTFVVRVYGAALLFVIHILLARFIGLEEYGIYAFAWTWLSMLAFLTPMGFDTGIVRFLSIYRTQAAWGQSKGALLVGRRTTVTTSLIATAVGIAGLWIWDSSFTHPYALPLVFALAFLPAMALMNLYEGIARGMAWVPMVAIPSYAVRPTLFLALATATVFGLGYRDGQSMVAAFGLACALTLTIQHWTYHRWLPDSIRQADVQLQRRDWQRTARPMLLVASFELMLCHTDMLMTGMLIGPGSTGVYSAAVRTSAVLTFVFFAVSSYAGPRIAEMWTRNDRRGLIEFTRKTRKWMALPTLTLALALALLGPFVLRLFKDDNFLHAYWPMIVLSGVPLLRSLAGPVDSLLIMTGHERQFATTVGIAAALNVALNAILIPWLGLIGAACATITSAVIELTIVSVLAGRYAGFIPFRLQPVAVH